MEHTKSQAAFEEARQYIPGGVNSPVRSFRSVGGGTAVHLRRQGQQNL